MAPPPWVGVAAIGNFKTAVARLRNDIEGWVIKAKMTGTPKLYGADDLRSDLGGHSRSLRPISLTEPRTTLIPKQKLLSTLKYPQFDPLGCSVAYSVHELVMRVVPERSELHVIVLLTTM